MNEFQFGLLESLRKDTPNLPAEMQNKVQSFLACFSHLQRNVGSQDEEINLESVKFRKNIDVFSGECSICLSEFKPNQMVKRAQCKHCFHSECIEPWILKQRTCPNCKKLRFFFE